MTGWTARAREERQASLTGLVVAVDVQHAFKAKPDRGARFVLPWGAVWYETDASIIYGMGLALWLQSRGASVLHNDARSGFMCGSYEKRALDARAADVYLACHVNAGGGSYPLVERRADDVKATLLGPYILGALERAYPGVLSKPRARSLGPGERGHVCIAGAPQPALILEPFFGDALASAYLLSSPALIELGQTIGEGVSRWFLERERPRRQNVGQGVPPND